MNSPTEENIETVITGLKMFFEHMIETKDFSLREFFDFMEPIFTSEGYRDTKKDLTGGHILILTEVGAGDFITMTPAIREIRRVYPDANITMVVHPRAFELAEPCPYVNEIILNPQNTLLWNIFDFYQITMNTATLLLEKRFDICFAFTIHPHTPLLMYMSGAKIRINSIDNETFESFNRSRGLTQYLMHLSTHLFPYNTYGYHRTDRFLSLIENLLHLPITNRKQELWYTPDDVEIAKSYLKGITSPIYSLNMGSVYKINQYPPEKYARLIELILEEEPESTFVILGGGQNDLDSAKILKNALQEVTYQKNILDLTNKVSYRQSVVILSLCYLHIGNDTGTMHMAAAAGCPVLNPIPYAASLPMYNTGCSKRWYPYGVPSVRVQPKEPLDECKNSHAYRGCRAKISHCITQIEPETLLKGFKLLKERIAKKINEPMYIH